MAGDDHFEKTFKTRYFRKVRTISIKFGMVTQIRPLDPIQGVKMSKYENQTCRTAVTLKIEKNRDKNRNISATDLPIYTKFGKMTQKGSPSPAGCRRRIFNERK